MSGPYALATPPFRQGLKIVEDPRIGEVFGEKLVQLRFAEGLQIPGQAETDHLRVIAGDDRKQRFRLLAVRISAVEQPRDRVVDDVDDPGDGERF